MPVFEKGVLARPAPTKRCDAAKLRLTLDQEAEVTLTMAQKMMRTFDKDMNKNLDRKELVEMLTAIDSSTPPGTPPADLEVDFILKQADVTGSWRGTPDGMLNLEEVARAMSMWKIYMRLKPELEQAMAMFDSDKSGDLDRQQLKNYLEALNDNKLVSEPEVDWMMKLADVDKSGKINRIEIMRATMEWYIHVEQSQKSRSCNIL